MMRGEKGMKKRVEGRGKMKTKGSKGKEKREEDKRKLREKKEKTMKGGKK